MKKFLVLILMFAFAGGAAGFAEDTNQEKASWKTYKDTVGSEKVQVQFPSSPTKDKFTLEEVKYQIAYTTKDKEDYVLMYPMAKQSAINEMFDMMTPHEIAEIFYDSLEDAGDADFEINEVNLFDCEDGQSVIVEGKGYDREEKVYCNIRYYVTEKNFYMLALTGKKLNHYDTFVSSFQVK